ncbi:hypothetical protein [Mesorhizobium sp. L-2-11]|uniref:hypothetical protein n=1 Tax=Mesorhizobium sp. L-2-11 TaxID=2744521 RepID=UPI0018ED2D55|nr:hypothetical protein [Mesorhizobium sp. L-2-11]BCH20162.1 hypothetical protein MesoLjLa_70130 [Mesorhizobium sp. L-2-11]
MMYLRIAALAVFLAVAALALWYRGEAISAEADRDRAIADLNTAVDANKAQEETIGRLRASAAANDRIIAKIAADVATISTNTTETNQAIGDLKDANEDVRAYLSTVVPADLKRVLDR